MSIIEQPSTPANTPTHHAGLSSSILGEHIAQAGSLNESSRLRFDFTAVQATLTKSEIRDVESWVNDKILKAIPRVTNVMSIDEAKERGALALFGEKYGDRVRVVQMGDSVELCGGTHVDYTFTRLGTFIILKEKWSKAQGLEELRAFGGKEVALGRYFTLGLSKGKFRIDWFTKVRS